MRTLARSLQENSRYDNPESVLLQSLLGEHVYNILKAGTTTDPFNLRALRHLFLGKYSYSIVHAAASGSITKTINHLRDAEPLFHTHSVREME